VLTKPSWTRPSRAGIYAHKTTGLCGDLRDVPTNLCADRRAVFADLCADLREVFAGLRGVVANLGDDLRDVSTGLRGDLCVCSYKLTTTIPGGHAPGEARAASGRPHGCALDGDTEFGPR
jgi:hypothetical protein